MSLDLALNVARSGLAAVQRGLAQNAQNVANAETAGYTRKAVAQESLVAGGRPMGLRTAEARREVDAALVARLDASRAAAAGRRGAGRPALRRGGSARHGARAVTAWRTRSPGCAAASSRCAERRPTPASRWRRSKGRAGSRRG